MGGGKVMNVLYTLYRSMVNLHSLSMEHTHHIHKIFKTPKELWEKPVHPHTHIQIIVLASAPDIFQDKEESSFLLPLPRLKRKGYLSTHTHTHTHTRLV